MGGGGGVFPLHPIDSYTNHSYLQALFFNFEGVQKFNGYHTYFNVVLSLLLWKKTGNE